MSIHIIYGCMYANKSSTLIQIAQNLEPNKILVVKHPLDVRYPGNATEIISHNGDKYPAKAYSKLLNIDPAELQVDHILIDEAQFYSDLFEFCHMAKRQGKRVYVAGLAKDFAKQSFGQIDLLLASLDPMVDQYTQLFAKCNCGNPAIHSMRLINDTSTILIGGSDIYKPVCDDCYIYSSKDE